MSNSILLNAYKGDLEHIANFLSLVILLIEKNIITNDELKDAKIKAAHLVEQIWAQKTEDAEKEFKKVDSLLNKFFGGEYE